MFDGLSTELMGASLYDLGREIWNRASKKEWMQATLKQLDLAGDQHDFATRYLEALVALRLQDKTPVVLNFFREKDIQRAFYHFYYGPPELRNNLVAHQEALTLSIQALQVGDAVNAANVDISAEVQHFWEIFRQMVHESKTMKEVELDQKIQDLRAKTDDIHQLLSMFLEWMRQQGKTEVQVANTIYNIDRIDTAIFNKLLNKTPRNLTPPPFNPPIFEGRDEALVEVREQLFAGSNLLMLVNGQGGIGKTTFAAKYWNRFQDQYSHLAYLYVGNGIENALLSLAPAVGISFPETMPSKERLEGLLLHITNLDKPCLLILDNANDAEDLTTHYNLLRRCSNFHILITSRLSRFEDAHCYPIDAIDENTALSLFKRHYPRHRREDDDLFRSVYHAVGGNTLVLEVLAKNLFEINQNEVFYPLSDLLKDLQERGLLKLSEQAPVKVHWQDFETTEPQKILRAMYDLRPLQPEETALLCNLAVLPPENIDYETLKLLLNPENPWDFSQLLTGLYRRGWIEKSDTGSLVQYKISPVVQDLVKSENPNLLEACRQMIDVLIAALDNETLHIYNYQPATVFTRLSETVVLQFPEPDYDLGRLCQNIGNFHDVTGDLEKAMLAFLKMEHYFKALVKTEPEHEGFKNRLAIAYCKLGDTHRSLGNLEQALKFFEDYFKLTKFLYNAYPQNVSFIHGLAVSYERLGSTHSSLGNLEQALKFFEECVILRKSLCGVYPQNVSFKNGLAISYSKLGDTHRSLGNLEQALKFFEDDLKLTKALYDAYPQNVSFKYGLAISYSKLGYTHSDLGNLERALSFFEKSVLLVKALHDAYPQNVSFKNGLAASYASLGETYSALGNLEQALKFFEDVLKLIKALYEAYPQNVEFKYGLAASYSKLGNTHSALGNLEQALKFFEDETYLFEQLYNSSPQNVEFKYGLATSYEKLGDTHSVLGNLEQALKFFEDETYLFEQLYESRPLNVKFKNGFATVYAKLGVFARDHQQDSASAKSYFKQAEILWIELVRDAAQYVDFQKSLSWVKNALDALP
jgi:tetratricopeptide (TPR) repeat protein